MSLRICGLLLMMMMPLATASQDISTYPSIRNARGSGIDWRHFYERANALTAEAKGRLPHHLDLSYGEDAKQKLDLYVPTGPATAPRPVFIFIHGGGFREGDRSHYGFVAGPFASSGIATIVVGYRLHPHRYPDQVNDLRLVLEWTRRNVAKYGGDPNRVYVGGHSAGGILSALVGVKTRWNDGLSLPPDFVKGIVPVSGPYDLRSAKGFVNDFVSTPAEREAASPVLNIGRTPPAVVALGSKETTYLEGSRALVDELRRRGGKADLVVLEGMGHDGSALAVGDAQGPLFAAILRMINGQ